MMIKLLDRGFAPVAIALSFVAGIGNRSGDELSFRGHYDTCSHDMRASTRGPRRYVVARMSPPRVGPRHGDPAPSQVAEVPLAGFDSHVCRAGVQVQSVISGEPRRGWQVTRIGCGNASPTSDPSYPMAASWK
jgi:hypothetical protein